MRIEDTSSEYEQQRQWLISHCEGCDEFLLDALNHYSEMRDFDGVTRPFSAFMLGILCLRKISKYKDNWTIN